MAFSRDFSDVGISSSDTILNRWSHVSMPCSFIGCLIKPSSARFSRKTCLILSSGPREANFSPQLPRTREETVEQTASRGSLLSSFHKCAAGFRSLRSLAERRLGPVFDDSKPRDSHSVHHDKSRNKYLGPWH